MSKVCQITGKFYVPEWDEWIVLKVSAAGLRTINKKGVYAAIMESAEKGNLERW